MSEQEQDQAVTPLWRRITDLLIATLALTISYFVLFPVLDDLGKIKFHSPLEILIAQVVLLTLLEKRFYKNIYVITVVTMVSAFTASYIPNSCHDLSISSRFAFFLARYSRM
jgi:hypothetical protein